MIYLKKKLTPEVALTLPWGYIHVYYHSSQTSIGIYLRSQVSVYRTIGPLVLNRQQKPDFSAAISRNNTRSLNQRHIPKRDQVIKTLHRSMFLNISVLNTLDILTDFKAPKENKICTLDDVRGDFLGPPHGTTPAAVIANKI